jgi:arylsulfatase
VVFLLDDTGFAQLGPYGGLVPTPNIDKLAANGLTYTNFHTTALCSPSRAAILAGRNHHAIGFGSHMLTAMGFPGYAGRVPKSAAGVGTILRDAGYTTSFFGKWDHTPFQDVTVAGPFDRWPTGEGFDHFYGFMAADTHNFQSVMWHNHKPVEPYQGDKDYHVTTDMADEAINLLTGVAGAKQNTKPQFLFFAPGAMHAPHHAPAEYIERFRGQFDMGWDQAREQIFEDQLARGILPEGTLLSERIDEIPAWDSLPEDERRLYARQMEAFAGQLAHTDEQIGRVIDTLERIGILNDTLIMLTSDNGASGEGGLAGSHNEVRVLNGLQTTVEENMEFYDLWGSRYTYNHYHAGWAMAGNTPFRYFKQSAHRGGQADPLIVSWPNGIAARGELRHQYTHITDLVPTILESTKVSAPEMVAGHKQQPFSGTSLAYTFDAPDAPEQHSTQYYEMYGNMGIYHDGWKAVSLHGSRLPWNTNVRAPFKDDVWELFNVRDDPSESVNLADEMPEKLLELQLIFDHEARANNVYPLYDDLIARNAFVFNSQAPKFDLFTYYPPGSVRIIEPASPPIKNKTWALEAYVKKMGTEGVLATCGGMSGGYSLYVKDGEIRFVYNSFNRDRYTIRAPAPAEGTEHVVFRMDWNQTAPLAGNVTLSVDGVAVASTFIPFSHSKSFSAEETFDIGVDTGTSPTWEYNNFMTDGFRFNGVIDKVTVEIPHVQP